MRSIVATLVLALVVSTTGLRAQDVPRGRIVDDVRCLADPTFSYSVYVPSTYGSERAGRLLIAFHPAARRRAIVEKYRAAAEESSI